MLITMLVPELYLIEILHQTTTRCAVADHFVELYLIEILHQTTTARRRSASNAGCILSKFYIKPQQLTPYRQPGEVVSYRNSTSNHNFLLDDFCAIAVVSYRNSTSNHNSRRILLPATIVVSYRNSTSNHNDAGVPDIQCVVVSYRNSTSNHNQSRINDVVVQVVSYRNSTSNHNEEGGQLFGSGLYLIEILHQTTTPSTKTASSQMLYLIEILHQTTTALSKFRCLLSCILSKFYIKPQLVHPS